MRLAVVGAGGRMGRLVLGEALDDAQIDVVAALERPDSELLGVGVGSLVGRSGGPEVEAVSAAALDRAEVIVDFSLPAGLARTLDVLSGQALVTGTTGLDAELRARLDAYAAVGPLVAAANFSTGVTLLLDLAARAAAALPGAAVEVVEAHHRHKRDAPSGTALALGRAVATARGQELGDVAVHGRHGHTGERPPADIAFHALRGGDIAGEHQVWLIEDGERLTLGHVAHSRLTFARGALRAARWVAGRGPGQWTMAQVLGL